MKVLINQNDVSDNIFEISGLEFRRSDQGGLVVGELSLESDLEFNKDDSILIFNDQDISIAKYFVTSKTFDYDSRLWKYNASEWIKKIDSFSLSIEEDYYEAMSSSGLPLFATFSNDGGQSEVVGPYIVLTSWLKYALSRLLEDDYTKVITPDWEESYLDFRCSLFNDVTQITENRNVFSIPYARLAFAPLITEFNIGNDNISFLSSLFTYFGLYVVFYNNRYYIKKNKSFSLPSDDQVYSINTEEFEKEKYDSVMIKRAITSSVNEEIYYPEKRVNNIEITKPLFIALAFFKITLLTYPYNIMIEDQGIVPEKINHYCTMSSGTVPGYLSYKIDSSADQFIASLITVPTIGYNSTDIYIYYLYYVYHNYYGSTPISKGGVIHNVNTMRKEIETDAVFWDSTSIEPHAVSIDFNENFITTIFEVIL